MTAEQRTAIAGYRGICYGYKKISQLMGMNENTIKTYCKRNGLGGNAAQALSAEEGKTCKCCGKPIIQMPGRKVKKFCSDRCRNRWWNTHLDLVTRKANYEFICPTCGKPFTAYGNANRKYCSHSCYIEDRFGGGRYE